MRLQFLGTGGYHPNARRHTACLMIPEIGLVFDMGTSAFRVPKYLRTRDLQIFISHAHLDHVVGLTFLLGPLLDGSLDRATVFAAESYLETMRSHLFAPGLFPVLPSYEFTPLPAEVPVGGNGVVKHVPLKHPGGSTGFRVDWPDRSFAYITDTTASTEYLEFIRGVDVLIHECQFSDAMSMWSEKTGHSNTTPVATLARDAGVGRLWLTHIDPQRIDDDPIGIEIARGIFPNTEVAEDLLEIQF
jgi:ribonuclease Z